MPKKLSTFDDVLDLWETHRDLSTDLGIKYVTAQAMRNRHSIGDEHWPKLVKVLAAKGFTVTFDDLVQMKFRRRAQKQHERSGAAA